LGEELFWGWFAPGLKPRPPKERTQCRRADIFDFSPDFSHFFVVRQLPASEGGRYKGKSAGLVEASGAQRARMKTSATESKRAGRARPLQRQEEAKKAA